MLKKLAPILLVLLLATALRSYRLTEVPPGLTHDEANHGREAIGILDGDLRYYFPLNYGSEPLYSYTVAGSMLLLGENLLALRLVNVVFGVAAVALAYFWARQAFDERTALLTALLMAVSFWPLASSREALRAGMLPFFTAAAVWFFWQIVCGRSAGRRRWVGVLGFALSLVATFHIYLAARVVWLLFPLFLAYLALVHRPTFRRAWRPALLGLVLAGLLVIPMFVYLANNPESQTRLSMLNRPLAQIQAGELGPIFQNAFQALLAFVWSGYGDQFLAYNIPGRPVFTLLTAVFFLLGIAVSLWRWKRPAYAFLLLWFVAGIIPSLVTGPTANTTRNLAALIPTYLLPVVGFLATVEWAAPRLRLPLRPLLIGGASAWLLLVALLTARDYFVRWGEAPEVRSAYQHTLVESVAYLQARETAGTPVIMSTVYPGPAHDASIALVLSGDAAASFAWTDARYALRLPAVETLQALIPASTPPHAAFGRYLRPVESVALRPDDLDPSFTLYEVDRATLPAEGEPLANFGGAVALLDARWLQPTVPPGETAELLTVWRVLDPSQVGPLHPPADTTETAVFTHVLDEAGQILAQRDALDAPSWDWQAGDLILQVHPVGVPAETAPGSYATIVGVYDPVTGERLRVVDGAAAGESQVSVAPLQVARP